MRWLTQFLSEGLRSRTFLLLFVAHSPNRYLATILLVLVAVLQLTKPGKVNICYTQAALWGGFLLAQAIGLGSFVAHFSSFNNATWAVFNYLPIVAALILCSALSLNEIESGLKFFIAAEAAILIMQYSVLMAKYKTPFVFSAYSGAGDVLSGSLMGFSSPLAISLAMISVYFIFSSFGANGSKQHLLYGALSAFFSTFPGMMSSVAVFVFSISAVVIIFTFREFIFLRASKWNIIVALLIVCGGSGLAFFLGGNLKYMLKIFTLMTEFNNPPIKVLMVQKVAELFTTSDYLVFGTGVGNFTSRAAAMVSGQYFKAQPFFISITPSIEMQRYVLPYWNHGMYDQIVGGSIGNSMINEPFNTHLSVLSECGVLGFCAWVSGNVYCFVKAITTENRSLMAVLIFNFGILFTNDWLAYASFSLTSVMLMKASAYEMA